MGNYDIEKIVFGTENGDIEIDIGEDVKEFDNSKGQGMEVKRAKIKALNDTRIKSMRIYIDY